MTEETKQLTGQAAFMEKVNNKLRDSIGDLLPDDVLKGLVEKQMHKLFFAEKTEPKPGRAYRSNETIRVPNEFEKKVHELIAPKVQETIESYLSENQDAVNRAIRGAVLTAANGVFDKMIEGVVSGLLTGAGDGARNMIFDAMNQHATNQHNGQF